MIISGIKRRIRVINNRIKYNYYSKISETQYEKELKKWYYNLTKKELDFNKPETFNEKIQYLKLNDNSDLKTLLCDKYKSKEWIKTNIGEKYVVPLIGVWNDFDEIDFGNLPKSFVLKCNHGCAYNSIVSDKTNLDINMERRKFNRWIKENYAFKNGFELQYKKIPPKIICEEYLGSNIVDCQFWCTEGDIMFISYIEGPHNGNAKSSYNEKWEKLDFVTSLPRLEKTIEKPKALDEMIDISKKISKNFKFVRVDFYILEDGNIKISEITFTPATGVVSWNPECINLKLGKMINLSGDNHE